MGIIEFEAQHNTIRRMFGHNAVLTGSIGTPSCPGRMEIHLDGRQIGVGGNFQEAMTAASKSLSATTRRTG
jgi:hypothetical protein